VTDYAVGPLMEVAAARLRRQRQFAGALARGGRKAAELERLLTIAADCVLTLAHPRAAFHPLTVEPEGTGLRLDGKLLVSGSTLPRGLPVGASLSAYALTLGYGQEQAFEALGRDYLLHHFQTSLGREVLFALGRAAHRQAEADAPGMRLRRLALRMETDRHLWDANAAQGLLSLFGDDNPGVTVTEEGFFIPLNSTLGLMLAEPAPQASGD